MSKSVTLLFPGQGAQYVGMGANLREKKGFNRLGQADASLGHALSNLMLEGPDDQLKLTQNTQPAILTHSIALLDEVLPILDKYDVKIERVLGHSVGEYAALVAAGSLSFEDAVRSVNLRGQYMQEAVAPGEGKMIALLKLPEDIIHKACQAVSTDQEVVMPANFNEPSQTVVSGSAKACDRLVEWLKENYTEPYRAVELNVSAPFHCSMMEPAADKLRQHLETIDIRPNQCPYIANIDAKEYGAETEASTIRENLYRQVAGAVKWTQSIQQLEDNTLCLEIGPGKVLMGLVRKINRQVKVLPMDGDDALEKLEQQLQELV